MIAKDLELLGLLLLVNTNIPQFVLKLTEEMPNASCQPTRCASWPRSSTALATSSSPVRRRSPTRPGMSGPK